MDCIECKAKNPDSNRFCGQCGAELGRSLNETVSKGFRDRRVAETEITEAVLGRLFQWVGWLGGIAAVIVAAFALTLGIQHWNIHNAVQLGKNEIDSAVREGKNDIERARDSVGNL